MNYESIETLCNQCQVEQGYVKRLNEKIRENGFLQAKKYFKRVNGEKSEYLFTNGVDFCSRGSYFLTVDNKNASHFENLIDDESYGVVWGLIGAMAAGSIALIAGYGIGHEVQDAVARQVLYISSTITGATIGLFSFGCLGSICDADRKKQIEKYLWNSEHREKPWDYDVVKLAFEGDLNGIES